MTDIYCKVCREPWDSYGLRHGDMDRAEAEMSRSVIVSRTPGTLACSANMTI